MKQHFQLYLSPTEERLIRALRQGHFIEARAMFTQLEAERRAEDSAICRQLDAEGKPE